MDRYPTVLECQYRRYYHRGYELFEIVVNRVSSDFLDEVPKQAKVKNRPKESP